MNGDDVMAAVIGTGILLVLAIILALILVIGVL